MSSLYLLEYAASPKGRIKIVDRDGSAYEFYFNDRGAICMHTPDRARFPVVEPPTKEAQYWLVTFRQGRTDYEYVYSFVIDCHPTEELMNRMEYHRKDQEAGRTRAEMPILIYSLPLTLEQYNELVELPEFQ